jgi:hypothetical protein
LKALLLLITLLFISQTPRVPVGKTNEITIHEIELTEIGGFGILRKSRPGIPAHLHTGVDIKPPHDNYLTDELIYAIENGEIISKRTDGPFAQLIIEHRTEDQVYWTVYEHITGIQVELFQPITKGQPVARFFKAEELDEIGWQFNHFHFEVLKKRPLQIAPSEQNPERIFNSYTLLCYTHAELNEHFYDPIEFLSE